MDTERADPVRAGQYIARLENKIAQLSADLQIAQGTIAGLRQSNSDLVKTAMDQNHHMIISGSLGMQELAQTYRAHDQFFTNSAIQMHAHCIKGLQETFRARWPPAPQNYGQAGGQGTAGPPKIAPQQAGQLQDGRVYAVPQLDNPPAGHVHASHSQAGPPQFSSVKAGPPQARNLKATPTTAIHVHQGQLQGGDPQPFHLPAGSFLKEHKDQEEEKGEDAEYEQVEEGDEVEHIEVDKKDDEEDNEEEED
jgi:hypothetical protein